MKTLMPKPKSTMITSLL